MHDQITDVEVSRGQPLAQTCPMDISKLPKDLAVVRMEHETISAMALAHPRDPVKMVEAIKANLRAYKAFAKGAKYAKPVGKLDICPYCGEKTRYKDNCPACRKEVPQKIATGLSIRAAEAINSIYGFTSITEDVQKVDEMTVKLTVTWMDYQQGTRVASSRLVSRTFKKWDNSIGVHNEDRFLNLEIPRHFSYLRRNVILEGVDSGLKMEMDTCVDEEQAKFLDDTQIKKILSAFAGWGVTAEKLEAYIGKRLNDFRLEDRQVLMGLYTSIKEEGALVSDLFGSDVEGTGVRVPPEYDALMKAGKTAEAQKLIGGEGFTVEVVGGIRQICKITKPSVPEPKKETKSKPTAPAKEETKTPAAEDNQTVEQLQFAAWEAARLIMPSKAQKILADNGIASQEEISNVTDPTVLRQAIEQLTAAKAA